MAASFVGCSIALVETVCLLALFFGEPALELLVELFHWLISNFESILFCRIEDQLPPKKRVTFHTNSGISALTASSFFMNSVHIRCSSWNMNLCNPFSHVLVVRFFFLAFSANRFWYNAFDKSFYFVEELQICLGLNLYGASRSYQCNDCFVDHMA